MTLGLASLLLAGPLFAAELPQRVTFLSVDGQTKLVGYLWSPEGSGRHPAVVMLHGRAGPYSSLANGVYEAKTLSRRHKEWGAFWAARGYIGLHVDSFSPRGYGEGFPRGSYASRPAAVSEETVRPLDAYGALRYLRSRRDVDPGRIGVQGWSNGGMTVLATMWDHAPGIENPTADSGFRAALAFYPGCGSESYRKHYLPYAPLHLFVGTADEEVSPEVCQKLVARSKAVQGQISITVYEGAEHNFDDPSRKKQDRPPDHEATVDSKRRAERFFATYLEKP